MQWVDGRVSIAEWQPLVTKKFKKVFGSSMTEGLWVEAWKLLVSAMVRLDELGCKCANLDKGVTGESTSCCQLESNKNDNSYIASNLKGYHSDSKMQCKKLCKSSVSRMCVDCGCKQMKKQRQDKHNQGRIRKKWMLPQHCHYTNIQSQCTAWKWMADTVEGLWVFTHDIWIARCTTLHNLDRAETLQNTQQQLNNQITELVTNFNPDNYQQEDHHLFMSQTLQQRLLIAKNGKYMWLHSVT